MKRLLSKDSFVEFFNFYEATKKKISDSLGDVAYIAFENGTVGSNTVIEANKKNEEMTGCSVSGGGCLSHFHWHISPLEKVSGKSTTQFKLPNEAKLISDWGSFFELMKANPDKLYTLIDYQNQLHFVDRSIHNRRSEWMRLLIAFHLKEQGIIQGGYSWRTDPREETSLETVELLDIKNKQK